MDAKSAISYIARAEARDFAPRRPSEARDIEIPYFDVTRLATAKYSVTPHGHIGHDNENRAEFVGDFLSRALAGISTSVDASGLYPCELHDSYSYLSRDSSAMREKYRGSLNFSKNMSHNHVVLMPDLYQMSGYGGLLDKRDQIPFTEKSPRVLFAGTTTGDKDPLKNARIQACLWACDHQDVPLDFYITNIAQMTAGDIQAAYPAGDHRLQRIFRPHISTENHWKYRYIMNVQGNTCCWSRVPMVLASKSLMLNLRHADGAWYYPLLHHGRDFYDIERLEDLPNAIEFLNNNPALSQHIVANANQFVQNFLGRPHALFYMTRLIEAMAENK